MDRLHPLRTGRAPGTTSPLARCLPGGALERRADYRLSRSGQLGALALLFAFATACDESAATKAPPPPQRFEAVTAKQEISPKELDGFCDVRDRGSLALPALDGKAPKAEGARWVNVWATWCKSCVEEMPMIERWKGKLGAGVLFVSADEESEALDAYRSEHPDTPATLRMKEPGKLSEWMSSLGLDPGAGLPLHLFVGGDDEVRCVRAGAVAEHHYAVIENLLR